MPKAGLNRDAVVDLALALVDEKGLDALSLAAVAERAGVASPSLYKHVGSLAVLRDLMSTRIMRRMTHAASAAALGLSRDDAVAALMREYRAFVLAHPGWYALLPLDPLHTPAESAEVAEAAMEFLQVFISVLRGYGLDESQSIHAMRRLRAAVHGFAALQSGGGFGMAENIDTSYDQLIDMVIASLPR
ncbi:TetR/AcrR family transcriptional regulator [Winogradskya humida]|uniref:TetR family transcriptional regulator n=1 Tax=Winogradskya humida TaxID=113566 RepID=A0ABQ3ZLX2_9ACTN|nr:TetR/AcrR family transcriptional regulator [Actinoplanes humidus]GIE19595.1 TetR family transcriptional regulator [Actinoplanes humidus]